MINWVFRFGGLACDVTSRKSVVSCEMNSRRRGNRLYVLYYTSVYRWAVTGYRLEKLGSVFIMSTIYKEGRKEGRERGRYLQVSICSFRSIPTTIHTLPE
jgi:hypothetical protein